MRSEQDVIDQLGEYFGWLEMQLDQPVVVTTEPLEPRHRRSRLVMVGALVAAAATLLVVVVVNRPGPDNRSVLTTPSTETSSQSTIPRSTSTGPQTTTPVTTVPSGLVMGEAIFPEDLVADSQQYANLVHRGLQAAMRSCMTAAGFDFRMAPDDPAGTPKPHILDAAYRQQYGYGYPASPPVDDAYLSWLQAQDSVTGFHTALYGSDPNAQMGGCTKTAYLQIYAPDGIAVAPRNREFNSASNQWYISTQTPSAIAHNAALAAAANDWSTCMSQHGITATTPDQLAITMTNQRLINTPATPQEIATALTDWTCEQSTDFVNRWYGTLQKATRQFAHDHTELISRIQAWKDAAGARSQLAINGVK